VAGVVGIDRWLLRAVSIDNGCVCGTWPLHSYELPWLVTPMRLDALAGGVGNVLARSSPGRGPPPMEGGWDMCEDMGVCIGWWCKLECWGAVGVVR
jgi:hypothetical protein